jgi:hypothetical protein
MLAAGVIASAAVARPPFACAAGAIVNTHGFEGYTLGSLAGQPESPSSWVTTGGAGSATVQSAIVKSGSKAVAVQKGANTDQRWAVPVTPVTQYPTARYIAIDWDMQVTPTGAPTGTFGPFLGVEAYDASVVPRVLGTLGVDATTGDILFQESQAAGANLAETGVKATFNAWNSFRILLDYQQHQYTAIANGTPLVTRTFVDHTAGTPLNHFTDADISALSAAGDALSMAQTGTAYYDNFRVFDLDAADFNFDGKVNSADLAVWKSSFHVNNAGDADLDGDSDGADFIVWQRHAGADLGIATAAVAAVPEPAACVMGLVAAIGCASLRGRR